MRTISAPAGLRRSTCPVSSMTVRPSCIVSMIAESTSAWLSETAWDRDSVAVSESRSPAAEGQQDAEAEDQPDEQLGDQDLVAPGPDRGEGSLGPGW